MLALMFFPYSIQIVLTDPVDLEEDVRNNLRLIGPDRLRRGEGGDTNKSWLLKGVGIRSALTKGFFALEGVLVLLLAIDGIAGKECLVSFFVEGRSGRAADGEKERLW